MCLSALPMNKNILRLVVLLVLLSTVLLTSCRGEGEPAVDLAVHGSVTGAVSTVRTSSSIVRVPRPSAPLGLFLSFYLAQGAGIDARSVIAGIDAVMKFLEGDSLTDDDATFTLLRELGGLLQINVPDLLNRSIDRPRALNTYVGDLTAKTAEAKARADQLTSFIDAHKEEIRVQRKEVSQMERSIKDALRKGDYAQAGPLQEQLLEEQKTLGKMEAQEQQSEDVLDVFEQLLQIADERLAAIASNREVMIAGLKVIELPGIEDLGVIEDVRSRRRRNRGGSSGGGIGGLGDIVL